MTVADFINQVEDIENKVYLEIGVYSGETFRAVRSLVKVGVDPDPLSCHTHLMTSDEFFAINDILFDVALIDGDHRYPQVRRDFNNACETLAPGGVIFAHDMVPPDKSYTTPEPTRDDGGWCGDAYKLLFLADTRGVPYTILDEPFGLTRFDYPHVL